jgi:DNA repair protein RecO (recombination protein O)
MEEKTSGIVVGGVAVGENDKILNVFTPKGVVSAKIKGVKKAGAKLKFASEPFCFAEFIFNKTVKFRTVIGASLLDSFYPIRENIEKYYVGATILEFARKFYKENIDCTDAFMLLIDSLKELAYSDIPPKSVLVRFLVCALSESGYALNVNSCAKCGCEKIEGKTYFDYHRGEFYCENCFDGVGREVLKETFIALKNATSGIGASEEDLLKALKLLDYYIEKETGEKLNTLMEVIKLLL